MYFIQTPVNSSLQNHVHESKVVMHGFHELLLSTNKMAIRKGCVLTEKISVQFSLIFALKESN